MPPAAVRALSIYLGHTHVGYLSACGGVHRLSPVKAVTRTVREAIERAKVQWPRQLFALPLDVDRKRRILARLSQLPIARSSRRRVATTAGYER